MRIQGAVPGARPEALDLLDRVTVGKRGGDQKSEESKQRELSPHAAMVEAGFRKKTITIPLDVERSGSI